MGATDVANPVRAPGSSDGSEETTVPTPSSFSDFGQSRLRVIKNYTALVDCTGTSVCSAFARGWHVRMVGGKTRFAEMVASSLGALGGIVSLSAGLENHAWAWALSAETFASVSHIERVCGRPISKTLLDVAHLVEIALAWVMAAYVGGKRVEITPLGAHVGCHILMRTLLPLMLGYFSSAGDVEAFVVNHPEQVIEVLEAQRQDTTSLPRADATCDIYPTNKLGRTVQEMRRLYIEYRSNDGWFKSVGGINEADKEGIFIFYGTPFYARKSVMVNPGRSSPELIVGELDVWLFRIGYAASTIGALRNSLTVCVLIFNINILNKIQFLILLLPLLGDLWGIPWAISRHFTWDADWLLTLISPSHVLWSWHYEDRPKRRSLLWAKAVSGLLTLLLSACSRFLTER